LAIIVEFLQHQRQRPLLRHWMRRPLMALLHYKKRRPPRACQGLPVGAVAQPCLWCLTHILVGGVIGVRRASRGLCPSFCACARPRLQWPPRRPHWRQALARHARLDLRHPRPRLPSWLGLRRALLQKDAAIRSSV
jgi:hypothetical protein